jgi:hypothetical protein
MDRRVGEARVRRVRVVASVDGVGQGAASGSLLGLAATWEVGFDGGELPGEVGSGVSGRVGAVDEGLVGGHTGEGDGGPVDVEAVEGGVHGVT